MMHSVDQLYQNVLKMTHRPTGTTNGTLGLIAVSSFSHLLSLYLPKACKKVHINWGGVVPHSLLKFELSTI